MNEPKTKSIVKRIAQELRADKFSAKLYRDLAKELGLTHHLRPNCIAILFDKPNIPENAPELYIERKDKREKPVAFINRVYGDLLGKGLTRTHIMDLDKALYIAEKNYAYYHGRPTGFDLPTKAEQIDRDYTQLTSFNDPKSLQELEDEIIALRRIHNLLLSRAKVTPVASD